MFTWRNKFDFSKNKIFVNKLKTIKYLLLNTPTIIFGVTFENIKNIRNFQRQLD